MNRLLLQTHDDQRFFKPGEALDGVASWQFERAPAWVQVRLYWGTRGKGDTDSQTVAVERFDQPEPTDSKIFRFTLPNGPYSFSGALISLVWVVELTAGGAEDKVELSFVLSPSGSEIMLQHRQPQPELNPFPAWGFPSARPPRQRRE